MDNVLIGQRIRQLRLDRALRQSDVAKQIGVSPAYLNLICLLYTSPSPRDS